MQTETELPFDLDEFVQSYIGTLAWSCPEDDDGTIPLEEIEPEDFDARAMARCRCECEAFLWRVYPYLDAIEERALPDGGSNDGYSLVQMAAHDFCLTRNGHGAGFWDGDWPTYGDMFTRIAESFGEDCPLNYL